MSSDHKFKKCAVCGYMVDISKLDCPKCGGGVFESEKVEREIEAVKSEPSVERRRFTWFRNIFSAKSDRYKNNKLVRKKEQPIIERKAKNIIKRSNVVGIAAVFGGTFCYDEDRVKERSNVYNELNPGFNKTISSHDFHIVFSKKGDDIVNLISADLYEEIGKKYGRTSKVVQIGRTIAFVTIVRIEPKEPEKVEILDFTPNSIRFT